jgi:hypothetical protein
MGHALMRNRHGLLVDFQVTTAIGTGERDVVPRLIEGARARGFHPRTLGADKGYDTQDCVRTLRANGVTPHIAQNTTGRRSAIDGRLLLVFGQSRVSSATAFLAQSSSTRALPAVAAAMSAAIAALLSARGTPRLAWWRRAMASSATSGSVRPTSHGDLDTANRSRGCPCGFSVQSPAGAMALA